MKMRILIHSQEQKWLGKTNLHRQSFIGNSAGETKLQYDTNWCELKGRDRAPILYVSAKSCSRLSDNI